MSLVDENKEILDDQTEEIKTLDELLLDNPAEKDTQSDSSPDEKPADNTPSSEGDNTPDETTKPLHKDSRFKEVIEERNNYKRIVEEQNQRLEEMMRNSEMTTKQIEELKSYLQPNGASMYSPPNSEVPIPNEFVNLYGQSDPQVYQMWQKLVSSAARREAENFWREREKARLTQEEKQRKEREAYEEQIRRYQQEYDQEVTELSKQHGFEANEFRAWFKKHPILTEDGEKMNWRDAAELYKALKEKQPSRRELGEGKATQEPSTEPKAWTISELSKISFDQIGKRKS